MIHAFASLYGEYPFVEEKYGHAEFLGWAAGMEHQTLTSLNGWGEMLVAHELAHQWWGDMITCDSFHHIWLNEGFATYSESLWREWAYGKEDYLSYQKGKFYYGPGTIYVEDPYSEDIFNYNLSYRKASCVLHMLRHVVGDSTFFEILHAYYSDPERQYGTATTEQFREICESISGMNLETFFQQWIYDQGYPDYRFYYSWKQLATGQYEVYGLVKQVQTLGPIFEMPLDITVTTSYGDTTLVLWDDEEEEPFSFIVNHEPLNIELDKEGWVLAKVTVSDKPVLSLENYQINHADGSQDNHLVAGETVDLIVYIKNHSLELENVNYEDYIFKSLFNYRLWNIQSQGLPDSLWKYKIIIWHQGLQKSNTFPKEAQNKITDYLNQGGNLLICSQNLAYDLSVNGNTTDSLFLVNHLGVNFIADVANEEIAIGIVGDPITNGLAISFNGPYGENNQSSRDVINPASSAVSIFKYIGTQNSAGTRLYHEDTGAKVVFLAFGLEGIAAPLENSAYILLSNILNWFESEITAVKLIDDDQLPTAFKLSQNYPNPFNPTTFIRFSVPQSGMVSLDIFNLMGQKVRTLVREEKAPGHYEVIWNGKDENGFQLSSGIYIYQLKTDKEIIQKKMLLIR